MITQLSFFKVVNANGVGFKGQCFNGVCQSHVCKLVKGIESS